MAAEWDGTFSIKQIIFLSQIKMSHFSVFIPLLDNLAQNSEWLLVCFLDIQGLEASQRAAMGLISAFVWKK